MPPVGRTTVSDASKSWRRAILSVTGGALFGLLAFLAGCLFGYFSIPVSLALLFAGSCLLRYWLGSSALIAVVSSGLAAPLLYTLVFIAAPDLNFLIFILILAGINLFVCLLGWCIGFLLGRCIKKRVSPN